ncbi:major facilitator superfamily transporter [Xylariales sp. PMI_506]|nr:major facilitator superfamily transporter [Xylariales sp. PMI_506]
MAETGQFDQKNLSYIGDSEYATDTQQAPTPLVNNETEIEWKPTGHEMLIIITLAIVSLLVALDASIIITALADIIEDLGADTTTGFWIGTSYLLVNAVTMPVIASISEIFGRPICLEFSLAMFSIGTVLCCTAQGVTVMLVGRCIQGVGGGGVHVLAGVIMTDLVPLRYRPKYWGIVLGAWALGTCVGPIIGGAITQHTTWRWIFYLMFPICAYGLIVVPILLTIRPRTESFQEKLLRVDWVGCVLFMGSATSFLVAICWGGTEKPWSSAATIVPLVVGSVGLVITLVWEVRFAKEPLLKRELFHDVSSVVAYICGAAQGFLMWGPFYYYPFYFMAVKGTTSLQAGVDLLPALLVFIPSSIISGRLITRFNNYRILLWIGWFASVVWGAVLVSWPYIHVTTAVWVITLMIFGLGQGIVLNAQQFATQAMCKAGDEGQAAAMYLFLRQFGAALSVGIAASVFQNVMGLKLRWEGLSTEIADQAEGFISVLNELPDDDEYKAKVIDAYIYGFGGVFALFMGVVGVAFTLSLLFVKHISLNKDLSSEHKLHGSRAARMIVSGTGSDTRVDTTTYEL